jgi:hypothetical protein
MFFWQNQIGIEIGAKNLSAESFQKDEKANGLIKMGLREIWQKLWLKIRENGVKIG